MLGGAGELDTARLAPAADEDLGLDDDLAAAGAKEAVGGDPGLVGRTRDLPVRDGQTLCDQQGLGVGFLDLHAWQAPLGVDNGDRDGTALNSPETNTERTGGGLLPAPSVGRPPPPRAHR